ncbi:SRPBCC family protein [Chitinophaga vietnamensis]|uniref:SRPBCC family protein n=1 Tax=Chitinophaga vietnamensis TaxID=2593957 RepID=UPI001177F4B9|nr:SRPBCC domain-containing protein [Chitinophaga vietnamensis]
MAATNAKTNQHEVTIVREFDAPRELVFRLWTEPALLAQWWGPHGFSAPECFIDPRPDGDIRIQMLRPDGAIVNCSGKVHEVVPPERIVFTTIMKDSQGDTGMEMRNTVTLASVHNKTVLTLHAVALITSEAGASFEIGMREGWSQGLDKLIALATQAS